MIDMKKEGYRAAPTHTERVYEAAKLFGEGKNQSNTFAHARLKEAFTTSDFPELLADAFNAQAQEIETRLQAQREFEPILARATVTGFGPTQLRDIWSPDPFERVHEGEEYKAGTLKAIKGKEIEAHKYGRRFDLTMELWHSGDFARLADFPFQLTNGAIKGENKAVAELLTKDGAWDTDNIGTIQDLPFNTDNLDAALAALSQVENHRGDLVDTGQLVLLHGPALTRQVNQVLTAEKIVQSTGTKNNTIEVPNPYRDLITAVESKALAKEFGAGKTGWWALVQSKDSDLPTVARTVIPGLEGLEIRVKNDQGNRIGGGAIPHEQGSFLNDTIAFRGRDIWGANPLFEKGAFASNG